MSELLAKKYGHLFDQKYSKPISTSVDQGVRDSLSRVIDTLGYNDFELTSEEISRINALKDCAVDFSNPNSVTNYGSKTTDEITLVMNDTSAILHSQNLEMLQSRLGVLLSMMREVQEYVSANTFKKMWLKNHEMSQFDLIVNQCQLYRANLIEDLKQYPDTFSNLNKLFRKLSVYIISGKIFESNQKPIFESTDIFVAQKNKDLKDSMDRFSRRLSSMITLRQTLFMQMAQSRIEKANIEGLIDNTYETLMLTVPSWKQLIRSYQLNKANETLSQINDLKNKVVTFTNV